MPVRCSARLEAGLYPDSPGRHLASQREAGDVKEECDRHPALPKRLMGAVPGCSLLSLCPTNGHPTPLQLQGSLGSLS